jgi:chemotaxis receptor (MCP) glutamine deamidase CheD
LNNAVYLVPGTLYAAQAPCVITTLVGSCVAVTMWSRRLLVGGMNHYLLPKQAHSIEQSPRYGETALAMLLARMQCLGCRGEDIEARIYGGAAVLASLAAGTSLGEQNIAMAWRFIHANALHVADEQAGGRSARRLALDVETGRVDVVTVGAP